MECALTINKVDSCRPIILLVRKHPKISALAATLMVCSCPLTLPLLLLSAPLLLLTSLLTLGFNESRHWCWHAALCNTATRVLTRSPRAESHSNLIALWRSDHIGDDPLPCSFFYKMEGFVDDFGEVIPDLVAQSDFSWNE